MEPQPYDPKFYPFLSQDNGDFESCMYIDKENGERRWNLFERKCPACDSQLYSTIHVNPIIIEYANKKREEFYKHKCMLCKAEWRVIQMPTKGTLEFKDGVYHASTEKIEEKVIFTDDLRHIDTMIRCNLEPKPEKENEEEPQMQTRRWRMCTIC